MPATCMSCIVTASNLQDILACGYPGAPVYQHSSEHSSEERVRSLTFRRNNTPQSPQGSMHKRCPFITGKSPTRSCYDVLSSNRAKHGLHRLHRCMAGFDVGWDKKRLTRLPRCPSERVDCMEWPDNVLHLGHLIWQLGSQ